MLESVSRNLISPWVWLDAWGWQRRARGGEPMRPLLSLVSQNWRWLLQPLLLHFLLLLLPLLQLLLLLLLLLQQLSRQPRPCPCNSHATPTAADQPRSTNAPKGCWI